MMAQISKHLIALYSQRYDHRSLKVPKCEIFDLFDFNDIYVIKSL